MASEAVLELTDDTFDAEVIDSDQPALVDFWAEWCMPCRALAPTIDELAADYNGKLKVAKVDIDSNRDVTTKYGINAIPTVLLFKNGEVVKQFVGITPKGDFASEIDAIVG